MADDEDLAGLDPYELMAIEASRLDQFFASAGAGEWSKPTRCEGWSVRDVLAHLAATEDYHRACLDGTVKQFVADVGAKGGVDLASANEIGVRAFDDRTPEQILETWRARNAENRAGFRARDGGDVDSSIGTYPARRQAFHIAFELATHADDVGVPVSGGEAAYRTGWLARFSRSALEELKPDLTIEATNGRAHVKGEGVDVELADEQFVQAVAARLPVDSAIDGGTAAILSATP